MSSTNPLCTRHVYVCMHAMYALQRNDLNCNAMLYYAIYPCMHVCMYVCMRVYIYIYIYMYTHRFAYTSRGICCLRTVCWDSCLSALYARGTDMDIYGHSNRKFTKTQTVTLTLTLMAINTLIHSHACSHFSRRYRHVSDNKHSNTVMSSFF